MCYHSHCLHDCILSDRNRRLPPFLSPPLISFSLSYTSKPYTCFPRLQCTPVMASHIDQIKAHALSIVCGRALKQGRDVRSMCSMLQVNRSVKAAIISNARRNLALAVALIDQHSASVEDMAWNMFQAQWLSKYNVFVGELEVYMTNEDVDCECAAQEALVAAVLPRLQLQHLSIAARAACMLLEQANPVHLTSLDVLWPYAPEASFPIVASLSRLSNLQQLSIGSLFHPGIPYPAGCFAGLPPRLTQLVVAFKLPDEAYGELPCQLRRLMLTGYNGSSLTHLQQLSALALCHPEGPGQALAAAVNSLTGLQHLTLGLSRHNEHENVLDVLAAMSAVPSLRDLRYQHGGVLAGLVAPVAKLTHLTCLVWEGDIFGNEEQGFLQMLQPLVQLEKLCLHSHEGALGVRSVGDLFSKHLTKLRSLHVVQRWLQEPLFSQVLAAASGLTSLTLGHLECPDRDLGMIACSAPRLRELTLLLVCMDEADYERNVPPNHIGDPMTFRATMATLRSPHMPHLHCLTLSGSLARRLSYPQPLKILESVRPHLQVQCRPGPGPDSIDHLGCLAWRASPTVKVWDFA